MPAPQLSTTALPPRLLAFSRRPPPPLRRSPMTQPSNLTSASLVASWLRKSGDLVPAAPQRLAQSTLCAAAWPPAPTAAAMATATQAPSTTLAGRVDKRRRRAAIIQAARAPVRNDVACGGGRGRGGTSSRGRERRGKQTGSQRGKVARAARPRLDADWASLASVASTAVCRAVPSAARRLPAPRSCGSRPKRRSPADGTARRRVGGGARRARRAVRVRGGARGAGCRRCAMGRAGAAGVGGG